MSNNQSWIGVDLDGTLAFYDEWKGTSHIGPPILPILNKMKAMIKEGQTFKIFTARAGDFKCIPHIQKWLHKHGLPDLEVTATKDFKMIELWDDRAKQVIPNTGQFLENTNLEEKDMKYFLKLAAEKRIAPLRAALFRQRTYLSSIISDDNLHSKFMTDANKKINNLKTEISIYQNFIDA